MSSRHGFFVLALAVAVGLALAVSPFASGSPDGLEKVAEDKGFIQDGRLAAMQEDAPVPDYAFPGVEDERLATGLAGLVGTLLVFGLGYGLARGAGVRRRRSSPTPGPSPGTPSSCRRASTSTGSSAAPARRPREPRLARRRWIM